MTTPLKHFAVPTSTCNAFVFVLLLIPPKKWSYWNVSFYPHRQKERLKVYYYVLYLGNTESDYVSYLVSGCNVSCAPARSGTSPSAHISSGSKEGCVCVCVSRLSLFGILSSKVFPGVLCTCMVLAYCNRGDLSLCVYVLSVSVSVERSIKVNHPSCGGPP